MNEGRDGVADTEAEVVLRRAKKGFSSSVRDNHRKEDVSLRLEEALRLLRLIGFETMTSARR